MNFAYQHLLPQDFAPNSRVWVYQSSRLFSMGEALQIEDIINHFTSSWKSHGTPVKGFGTLFFGQFVILLADENSTGVSGCSTDSSVRLVKELETLYKVSMFDRQALAFVKDNKIQLLPLNQLQYAVENSFITPDTLYFNNLVQTKEELESKWIVPVKESWLANRILQSNQIK
jgi:hypothetical protein